MTPPNRIYIRPYSRVATEVHWRVLPYDNGDGTCVRYIKYDALLEWATTNRDKLDVLSDNDAVRWGQRNAFQQMIDKLNQM